MGFWDWLTGGRKRIEVADVVWLTAAAKWQGIARQVQGKAGEVPVLVLAHFPATLAEVRDALAAAGTAATPLERPASPAALRGQIQAGGPGVYLGLANLFRPDPFPAPEGEEGSPVAVVVAERHFLRERDDAVTAFVEQIGPGGRVTFHTSLDDPLMKIFAGDWVAGSLRRLGMRETDPIESAIVGRRIRAAQAKIAGRVHGEREADSAEEWLQVNGLAGGG